MDRGLDLSLTELHRVAMATRKLWRDMGRMQARPDLLWQLLIQMMYASDSPCAYE